MPNENADVYTVAQFGDMDHFKRKYTEADLNVKSQWGSGLLHYAISGYQFDIALFLLDHGIDVNLTNNAGQTALHSICMVGSGHYDVCHRILQQGVDVNIRDKYGNPAIWTAAVNCKGRNYDIVRLLMQYGPDVTIKNNVGLTALDIAGRSGDQTLCDMLTEFKEES